MSKYLSNLDQEEIKGDKNELVIGTPLGTYVLKIKNITKGRMDFHTSEGEEQSKGETFQKHPYNKRFPKIEDLEDVKLNFEEKFKHLQWP